MHWDTRLALLNPKNTASYAATTVSASSKLVAVGYQNGLIAMWNSTTALLVHEVNLGVPVSCLKFNHTGSCIAAGGRESIKCWNPSTAVEQLLLPVTAVPVLLEFSDDDSLLFAILRCNKLEVYNIEDCSVIAEFDWGDEKLSTNIVGGFPLCVSLNSQRTRLAVAYRGFPVSIWDIEKKAYLKKIRLACGDLSHRLVQRGGKAGFTTYTHDSVQTIEYHSVTDELFLSYMAGNFVKWDPETNEQVTSPIHVDIHVMKCSPDGTLVITGNSLGQIQFWSSATLELLFTLEDEIDGDAVRKLCLSTDGGRVFDIRGIYCNIWEPEILQQGARIYRETRPSLPNPSQDHNHSITLTNSMSVTCLSPSPDGSYFIVGTENGRVVLYSMASGKRLKILYRHRDIAEITSITWSKDGQFLATGDTTSMVLVYRVTIHNGRTEVPTEPLQANYGDFEIDSDYDDANFLALESALEITATEVLRGLAKVAGRHDGLIKSLLLSENNDLLIVSTLNADSVWQLNQSIEVEEKSIKVVDSCLTICYGGEKRHQLLQHPQNTDSIMIVAPESVRILSWSAVKTAIKNQEQQAPLSVDYNSFQNKPFPSEYSTSGETSSPEQGIWELERSCLGVVGNYDVLVTCLSTQRVGQPGRRREISVWRIDGASDNPMVNIRFRIGLGTSDTSTTIHSLLGISGGKIYFLDTNGCLCSQGINLEELTGQKEVPSDVSDLAVWFCLPRGQITPELSSTISCAIVWNQDVIFTRKEKVIVVKRGLRGQGIRGSSK